MLKWNIHGHLPEWYEGRDTDRKRTLKAMESGSPSDPAASRRHVRDYSNQEGRRNQPFIKVFFFDADRRFASATQQLMLEEKISPVA
jgi:hypothetical protein